ncbi:MAG: hypothetical protein ACQPRJ_02415 [Solitalea-like symbiont of Acarus siro]
MKKFLLLASMLLTLSFNAFSQQPGTPDYLSVKNGFKIFKLGAYIRNYTYSVRLISDDEVQRYEITDQNLLSVGDGIQLKRIVLYVKYGLITNIHVLLDRKYNEKFLATLIAAYGRPDIFSSASEAFSWSNTNKSVKLTYFDKYYDDQSLAIFSNN